MSESSSPPPAPGAAHPGEEGLNEAWLQSEMHDLFLSRETGTSLSSAALDEAINTLKVGEPLSLPQAFDLLHQAQLGDMRIFGQMPVRATASPFIPSLGSAYIVSRRLCRDDQSSSSVDPQHQAEAISVTFQSILNSEVWWSKDVLGFGVAARPMGRNVRTWKKPPRDRPPEGGAASPTEPQRSETHGYRGRLYTLVARKTELPNAVRARAEAAGGAPSAAAAPQVVEQQQLLAAAAQQAAQQQQQQTGFAPVAQQQQPTSGPPSPTRSTSPTRASKRPRGSSGSGVPGSVGQSERYIAVGDIGIVQVWRPRASFEPPRTPAAGPPQFRVDPTAPQAVALGGPQMMGAMGPLVVPPNYLPADPTFPGAPPSVRRPIAQPLPRGESPLDEKPRYEQPLPLSFFQPQSQYEAADVYVVNGSLRVRGDLICEGSVFGQFITGPRQADYSEWFKWHDDHLPAPEAAAAAAHDEPTAAQAVEASSLTASRKPPPPGSVVRLRPPEQVLTLDTDGPGPCMIVSTSPSLAAGVPVEPTEAETGALVAFMGQVPVRCRGAVKVGDRLVPSGLGDGTAVARLSDDDDDTGEDRAVGVAMEAIVDDDGGVHVVNAFIRWDNAMSRKLGQVVGEAVDELGRRAVNVGRGVVALWLMGMLLSLALVAGCTFFDAPPKLYAALDQPLRVVLKCLALMAFGTTVLLVLLLRTSFVDLHVLLVFWGLFLLHYFVGAVLDAIDYQNHTATLALDATFTVLAVVYHWILLRALSNLLRPRGPDPTRQQRPSLATRLAALLGRVARGAGHSSKAPKVSDHDGASNDS